MRCILCESNDIESFGGEYHHCGDCDLIFKDASRRLDRAAELAQYELHQNDPADPAYRSFLQEISIPLLAHRPPPATVLDFGCGPGPALAEMLREAGYHVSLYDPFFEPDRSVLRCEYDVITLTEVIEHVFDPRVCLGELTDRLRADGSLALMTAFHSGIEGFADWYYQRDPTHVTFLSTTTIDWIAAKWSFKVVFAGARSAILSRL